MRILLSALILLASLGPFARVDAQMTAGELAEREAWETFLMKAKIIGAERVGEGVTKPRKLTLKRGGIEAAGIWKNPVGPGGGVTDKWESEVAAYLMDKLLSLNMIPPTVERRYRGWKGSLQLWVTVEMSELKRVEKDIPFPPENVKTIERMQYLQRAFDNLVANADRTLQNLLWTKDWRLILIDHSQCFRHGYMHTDQLIYGKYGMLKELGYSELPRAFVDRIRGLTAERIRQAVGLYLNFQQIEAVLKRKAILLREIDEMIAERGEAAVLY